MGKKGFVTKVSLIVALGGFLMGFDASVISGVIKFIEPEFGLSKIQLGWAVSCLTLTSTLAMMVAGPISDKYGRKLVLKYAAVLYAISAISSAMAPSFTILVIARMIGGLGVGASLIVAPMYIAEISPANMRGRMVSFNQLNIVIGISVAFFTNYLILQLGKSTGGFSEALGFAEHNWRWMLGLETLPAVLYFAFLFAVPRSPRWLAMRGDENVALAILAKANGDEKAKNVMADIKESLAKDVNKKKARLSELFKPALKLVLLIGIVIAILQQITGINAVFFYAPMIFEQTGIGTDASFSQAILVGLTNLVFTILAIWLIDKIGRKILLIIGFSGIFITMSLLAYAFSAATYQIDMNAISSIVAQVPNADWSSVQGVVFNSDIEFRGAVEGLLGSDMANVHLTNLVNGSIQINSWLVLIAIIGFVASFAISVGPVMWVLFSELFPNRVRGLAISFAGFINSAISFSVQLVFPWELQNLGNTGTFLIFGIFGVIGLVFVLIFLPETKGKSLEELEIFLVNTNQSKKS
ncbi:MAG: sugar porter family MFS transporter [Prolixibacteraceae bacterium]|nr:sugar porter family MFS transporter [Prolixibacteraceae bacterium]